MIILNSQSFLDILKYIGEILKKAWKWFIILYLTFTIIYILIYFISNSSPAWLI